VENAKNIFCLISIIVLTLVLIGTISEVSAMANPAAAYCKQLDKDFGGYKYSIEKDSAGNEYGICSVDGKKFKDWDFYNGKVGQEYAKKVDLKIESSLVSGAARAQLGKALSKKIISGESALLKEGFKLSAAPLAFYNQTNYSYWDWRSPPNTTVWNNKSYSFFDNINGWLTSVKDQASCGSCWSFAVVGAIEPKYKLNLNDSRVSADLSEQYSISCDNSCYAGYTYPNTYCNTGCDGGWLDLNLNYVMGSGTVDENCFSYSSGGGDSGNCANKCADYSSRLWTIGGADYSGRWQNFTYQELEQWIIDYGPSPIGIYMVDNVNGNGFINCGAGGSSNHAVVLVGYNDTGNNATSYWIVKNSWGSSYGKNGYFYIKFNDRCNVGTEVYYLNLTNTPEFKPTINFVSPSSDISTSNSSVVVSFNVTNKVYSSDTCDLIVDNLINQTNSTVKNETYSFFTINSLSIGQHNISVKCWENSLGIINNSINRSITVRSSTISANLDSPTNNHFGNLNSQNFICSGNSNVEYNLTNMTFYLWNDTALLYNNTKSIGGISNSSSFNYAFSNEISYKWNCKSGNSNSNYSFASSNYSFIFDITRPNMSITGIADGYSETSSGSTLTFSYNVLDANNVSNCSLIINGAVNSVNTTINSNSITSTFSAGSYVWSINCLDYAGNTENSSVRSFSINAPVVPPTTSGGGGGGGGGSSYVVKKTINITVNYSINSTSNKQGQFIANSNDNLNNSTQKNISPRTYSSISEKITATFDNLLKSLSAENTKIYIYTITGVIIFIVIILTIVHIAKKSCKKGKKGKK